MTTSPDPSRALLQEGPRVINVGLESFAADLEARGVPVVHVGWRPPAGSDETSARHLATLQDGATAAAIDAANASVLGIITAGAPGAGRLPAGPRGHGARGARRAARGAAARSGRACPTDAGGGAVRDPLRGLGRHDDAAARGLVERGAVAAGALPQPRRGRPDDRPHHRVDAGLRGGEPRRGNRALRHHQRGARRGAALRRQRRAGDPPARAGSPPRPGPLLGAALRAGGGVDLRRDDGPGSPHGRRDAPAQHRRLRAARPRA